MCAQMGVVYRYGCAMRGGRCKGMEYMHDVYVDVERMELRCVDM